MSLDIPIIANCWWQDVALANLDNVFVTQQINDSENAFVCRESCQGNMWSYIENEMTCFCYDTPNESDQESILLTERSGWITGRSTCRVSGDYSNIDIVFNQIMNAESVGKTIAELDGVDMTQCAVACFNFPRCVAFDFTPVLSESGMVTNEGMCDLKAAPIFVRTLSQEEATGRFVAVVQSLDDVPTVIIPPPSETPIPPVVVLTTTTSPSPTTSPREATMTPTTNPSNIEITSTTTPILSTTNTPTPETTTSTPDMSFPTSIRPASQEEYGVVQDYRGRDFIDSQQWLYETFNDPTRGYVDYISMDEALGRGMIEFTGGDRVIIRSDSRDVATGRGRKSIRISSKRRYEEALVVWKVNHMPGGCGNWPALWLVGPDWPNNGEIDVVEGANVQRRNNPALHTGDRCSMFTSEIPFNGNWIRYYRDNREVRDCFAYATPENYGCAQGSDVPNSFGVGLNEINGGYYVSEMNSKHIKIWFFPFGSEPAGILNGNINITSPDNWPLPLAAFAMGNECPYGENFRNQVLVVNNTFCGGYAGWNFLTAGCPASVPGTQLENCEEFVRSRPEEFTEAFWDLSYIRVYEVGNGFAGVPEGRSPPNDT